MDLFWKKYKEKIDGREWRALLVKNSPVTTPFPLVTAPETTSDEEEDNAEAVAGAGTATADAPACLCEVLTIFLRFTMKLHGESRV